MSNKDITISHYLNTKYKDFAFTTIENRAIPSYIDGFKPVQRKIMWTAHKLWKGIDTDKPLKVFELGGQVTHMTSYNHGDTSCYKAIDGLAQSFKNSIPLLEAIGQFGSLRVPVAGAPRYIRTKLSSNFRLLYTDFELITPQIEEGNEIEPKYLLPIVPTILLNGTNGLAVGFTTNILNRNPLHLVDYIISYLKNDGKYKQIKLLPWYSEYNGNVEIDADNNNKYIFYGAINVLNTNTVEITELPPMYSYDEYEVFLNTLIDKKIIVDYDNDSAEYPHYILKYRRDGLSKLIQNNDCNQLLQQLKLVKPITEIITALDENNKLIIFNSIHELIDNFIKFRLNVYQQRIDYLLQDYMHKILILENKANFIKYIIDKKLIISNVAHDIVESNMQELNLIKIDNSYQYLLSMPISTLTNERYNQIKHDLNDLKLKRDVLLKQTPKMLYIADLITLQSELKQNKLYTNQTKKQSAILIKNKISNNTEHCMKSYSILDTYFK